MPDSSAAGDTPGIRLGRARHALAASVAAPAGVPPRQILAPSPVSAVRSGVAARARARAEAGLVPFGTRSPRGAVFGRVVVPSAVLAVVDAALLVGAVVAGRTALAVAAAALLVVFVAAAWAGRRYMARDPLRFPARERVEIAKASRWRSRHDWSGREDSAECALVAAAADAGARIAASRAWASGELARSGVVLALGAELDQVDDAVAAGIPPEMWERFVTRVAALTAYSDTVHDVGDAELEQDDVEALAFFLSGAIYDAV